MLMLRALVEGGTIHLGVLTEVHVGLNPQQEPPGLTGPGRAYLSRCLRTSIG